MPRPEICLQQMINTIILILSLCYHIEAELGYAEEQPNKE